MSMARGALLAAICSGCLCAATAGAQNLAQWMAALNGDRKLSELSLPGTHDSGARYDPWYGHGTTKCQDLSIRGQLDIGVRFLDIRCYQRKGEIRICHGPVDQRLTFEEVLRQCSDFLSAQKTECIIMSIQENCGPIFEPALDAQVRTNRAQWYLGAGIPKLNAVRGKIVLLRRFHAENLPEGIDATDWPDDSTNLVRQAGSNLLVQDHYRVRSIPQKWRLIQALYDESKAGDSDRLAINFASGYRPVLSVIPWIKGCSKAINPRIEAYFTPRAPEPPPLTHAITVLDFASRQRCAAIIRANTFP